MPHGGFPVDAFGLRWWFDTSHLDPDVAANLRELWARAAPADAASDAVPEVPVAADPGAGPEIDEVAIPSRTLPDGRIRVVLGTRELPDVIKSAEGLEMCLVPDAPEEVPYSVSRSFTMIALRHRTGQALLLHSLGVSGPSGAVVALVGRSGMGKTTAAAELGTALGYVTDETVIIEPDLTVRPYPKPLSIITDDDQPHAKTEYSPDELGLLVPPEKLRLAAVVVLDRENEGTAATLEPISIIEAALDVLPQTSALPRLDDPLDRLTRALVGHGGPFRLRYSEIADCRDLVTSLTVPDPVRDAAAPAWQHVPGPGADPDHTAFDRLDATEHIGQEHAPEVTPDTVVTRGPWDDAIASEGEVLLLRGHTPIHLSGIGAALWLNAADARTVATLHDHVVADLGPHPDSEALVTAAVRDMMAQHALVALSP